MQKLSTVVEGFRELDLAFNHNDDLAVVQQQYASKLIHAITCGDELSECEALKSLGDVYLQKTKTCAHKTSNFRKACALYMALSHRCKSTKEKQVAQHRIRYAEKCTKLIHNERPIYMEIEISDNSTLAVSIALQKVDQIKTNGQNMMPLIQGYTDSFVRAIIDGNKHLEVESLKTLGDLYQKRGVARKDSADLDKASALYIRALKRCDDSNDGIETLAHRIRYARKVKEKVKRQQQKEQANNRKSRHRHQLQAPPTSNERTRDFIRYTKREGLKIGEGITRPVNISRNAQGDSDSIYKEQLKEGCRALETADMDKAEQHFATALKSVHVKNVNTSQHWEEAEPLYKLGDVYLKRGIQSKGGGDFTKAAALCNSALVRSRAEHKESIKQRILNITQSFLTHVLETDHTVDAHDGEKHKLMLKGNREHVEKEIKRIEQQVDPYSLDDDDPKTTILEEKRAEEVKALFVTIAYHRKEFISGLVDECIEVMGPPPCMFAFIGLGSQATGLVTPYSDLEFAILVERETDNNVRYFRNLTHYLHLKVINLGETILPAMAIKSLNDFHSNDPLDNWYYDFKTPRGFAFDGAMPNACKTPLGRGKTCELIHTPSELIKILKDNLTMHLKKGYHLASILGNVCILTGEQDLVDEYNALWSQQLQGTGGIIPLLDAVTTLSENASTFKLQAVTSGLLNVKKEIYRFCCLAVSCWALLNNIKLTTTWETIQKMKENGVINSENAHHLMVLVSISAELRLRTYMNNRGQVENMSALSSMPTDTGIEEKLQKVFYFSNTQQLMRYYYSARPLKYFISQLAKGQAPKQAPILFEKSSKLKSEVYKSLCDYQKSKTCLEQALHDVVQKNGKNEDLAESLNDLGDAWRNIGDSKKAVSYYEQSLQMQLAIYGDSAVHPNIASTLNNLGNAQKDIGDYRGAIGHYEQSLQMKLTMYDDTVNPAIAASLYNLGATWNDLGHHRKSVSYFEESLQMRRRIYGDNTTHPDIADSLYNLGNAWRELGDFEKALSYSEQSLQMQQTIYGESTAHPAISASLDNLANTWIELGNPKKAINFYEQALKMRRSIFGEDTVHPDIARSLHNIGNCWSDLGDYRKSQGYFEQSLEMMQSIHGNGTAHSDMATLLSNLGAIWRDLGNPRKAVSYYEQSIKMQQFIYGESSAHPDIARSLDNLGHSVRDLRFHKEALTCYEYSLRMRHITYGQDTAHPAIAVSLSNLGNVWSDFGDLPKAIGYHKQSLQMMRSIYGESTAHRAIAKVLNNLGANYGDHGDYTNAVGYYEQSLQMQRSIYGENSSNHDIADSLFNLGNAWSEVGDHGKAISCYEQSLQMRRHIYGESIAHYHIAQSLSNLGHSWSDLGDYRQAYSYHEEALHMLQSIYVESTAHPDIAQALCNLGAACGDLKDYRKAVRYFEQSLKMQQSIYIENTLHPHIALSLHNLAAAWWKLGEYDMAERYALQAMQMKCSRDLQEK
ncbi:uncharacterized protein LOC144875819 [Branchiostoma floridae x Branchiostoma japonicum]